MTYEPELNDPVTHTLFGKGVVIGIKRDSHLVVREVTIHFDIHGSKALIWGFAKSKITKRGTPVSKSLDEKLNELWEVPAVSHNIGTFKMIMKAFIAEHLRDLEKQKQETPDAHLAVIVDAFIVAAMKELGEEPFLLLPEQRVGKLKQIMIHVIKTKDTQ